MTKAGTSNNANHGLEVYVECIRRILNQYPELEVNCNALKRQDQERSPAETIASGVRKFLDIHKGEGTRPGQIHDAVRAVATAAVLDADNAPFRSRLYQCLGLPARGTQLIRKAFESARVMTEKNEIFQCHDRTTRSDCYVDEAHSLVNDYVHDEVHNGTRIDTDSARVVKIMVNGVAERHPLRIFNDPLWHDRYMTFTRLDLYKTWMQRNPDKTISETVFRTNCCKCCKAPKEQSCVNLHTSALNEYVIALKNAITENPHLQDELDTCDCPTHRAF